MKTDSLFIYMTMVNEQERFILTIDMDTGMPEPMVYLTKKEADSKVTEIKELLKHAPEKSIYLVEYKRVKVLETLYNHTLH